MSGRGLFDPTPPPKTERELLLEERHRLLQTCSSLGGEERDRVYRRLDAIKARLAELGPAPRAPAAVAPSRRPRPRRVVRDGRMAATGERD